MRKGRARRGVTAAVNFRRTPQGRGERRTRSHRSSSTPTPADKLPMLFPRRTAGAPVQEEIDVVSISEKSGQTSVSTRTESLPRVPSALDRHNIQRTMASAITSRRAPVTPPRKRMPTSAAAPAAPAYSPARKRTRGPGRRPRRSSPDTDSDPDVPDLEKRSLHNDMERMRRIGLKNLFDQLKEQIPATRDKERAPKVVILREAASLCRRLQAEEREREALRRHQTRLLAKLKKLRSIHAAARSHAHPVHAAHHATPTVWAH